MYIHTYVRTYVGFIMFYSFSSVYVPTTLHYITYTEFAFGFFPEFFSTVCYMQTLIVITVELFGCMQCILLLLL